MSSKMQFEIASTEMDFIRDGLCAQVDHDVFFPERGGSVRSAQKICRGCPVTDDCLEFALRSEQVGVWGGTSEAERIRIQKQRQASRAA